MIAHLLPGPGVFEGPADLEDWYFPPAETHLRVNFISSLDGAVEIGGRSGPLGGPADRQAFMAMRAVADAVLVGAGTARAENYGPVRLSDDARSRRTDRGQPSLPPLAVVSARGDLDPRARLFGETGHVLVLTTEAVRSSRPDLSAVAELIPCGDTTVDIGVAMAQLRDRGLGRILCEGGPALARTLLDAHLIDELCLTIAPLLAGTGHRLMGAEALHRSARYQLTGLLESESMLLARYGTETAEP